MVHIKPPQSSLDKIKNNYIHGQDKKTNANQHYQLIYLLIVTPRSVRSTVTCAYIFSITNAKSTSSSSHYLLHFQSALTAHMSFF